LNKLFLRRRLCRQTTISGAARSRFCAGNPKPPTQQNPGDTGTAKARNVQPTLLEECGEVLESLKPEALLNQIAADPGFSVRCKALFERQFSAEQSVRQIVAALSA
jgi:hypothetical protein